MMWKKFYTAIFRKLSKTLTHLIRSLREQMLRKESILISENDLYRLYDAVKKEKNLGHIKTQHLKKTSKNFGPAQGWLKF